MSQILLSAYSTALIPVFLLKSSNFVQVQNLAGADSPCFTLIRLSHSPYQQQVSEVSVVLQFWAMGHEGRSMEKVLGKTSSLSKQRPKKKIVLHLLIGTTVSISDSFTSLESTYHL